MYTARIACLMLFIASVSPNGFGGVHVPRMNTVVTNDFSVSEFKSCFETVETTATNLVLTFKENVKGLYYEISGVDEVNMCRGCEKICLGIDQTLCVGDGRHASLVVKGYADESTAGFELIKAFDARAFGRGVAIQHGRLLLRSKNRKIQENMAGVDPSYLSYGDNEVRARIAEGENLDDAYKADRDWANPGCQSLKHGGPNLTR